MRTAYCVLVLAWLRKCLSGPTESVRRTMSGSPSAMASGMLCLFLFVLTELKIRHSAYFHVLCWLSSIAATSVPTSHMFSSLTSSGFLMSTNPSRLKAATWSATDSVNAPADVDDADEYCRVPALAGTADSTANGLGSGASTSTSPGPGLGPGLTEWRACPCSTARRPRHSIVPVPTPQCCGACRDLGLEAVLHMQASHTRSGNIARGRVNALQLSLCRTVYHTSSL